jgi:hypothetical protein
LYLSFPPNYIVIKSIILVSKQRASTNFHRQTIECLFPNSPEVFCCEPLYFRKNFRNAFSQRHLIVQFSGGKILNCNVHAWSVVLFMSFHKLKYSWYFDYFREVSSTFKTRWGNAQLIWDTGEYSGIYRSNKVKYY